MNSLALLLAPLALIPALAQLPGVAPPADEARATPVPVEAVAEVASPPAPPFEVLEDGYRTPEQNQVSIEQHVIVRIAPSRPDPRVMGRLLTPVPDDKSFKEEKHRGCIPISMIAGITPWQDSRLLLVLRDRRVLSASLEKSCRPEEFYSGAYVERSEDGQLCPHRERLQSRTGSKCQVAKLSRLVQRD